MSIIRKSAKPIVANMIDSVGLFGIQHPAKVAIHVPKNSSITTDRGSSPQNLSITLSVQTPTKSETITNNMLITSNNVGEQNQNNAIHINKARNAPAVPGATGTKPVPRPVEIIT